MANESSNSNIKPPCLECENCKSPLLYKSNILSEKLAINSDTVFSYSFECEALNATFPVYSALNPSSNRFDVCAVKMKDSIAEKLKFSDEWYTKDTWFVGFAWTFVSCSSCSNFLGWLYRNSSDEKNKFIGLILTKLRPSIAVQSCSFKDEKSNFI